MEAMHTWARIKTHITSEYKEQGKSLKVQIRLDPGWWLHFSVTPKEGEMELIPKLNQSINQSNFYNVNIPGEARLSGATAKSVFNNKIEETVP